MTAVKLPQLETFFARPDDAISAILLHGPNDGKIGELAKKAIKAICPDPNDPFGIVQLKEDQLKENPGQLRDETLAMSFTQSRKVIHINSPGPVFTKQFSDLLSENIQGNLIVVEAGNLKKGAALRKACEAAKHVLSLACYEDTIRESHALITQLVQSAGKTIEQSAAQKLVENFSAHRNLLTSEINKLLSFCLDNDNITLEDVENLCDDQLESGLEEICDLVLNGQLAPSVKQFDQLGAGGVLPGQLLNILGYSMNRLKRLRLDLESGKPAAMVVKSARPPIFFKRHDIVKNHLQKWSLSKLKTAEAIVFTAVKTTRLHPEVSRQVTERALMNISVIANK